MPDAIKKILIVEDELAMANALAIKLTKSGYEAKSVFNGQECMNELLANHYDLVLLDIMMPVMDGWQVLEEIKQKAVPVKVIITSNLSQEEDITKAKALGAVDFFIKSNESLADIVNEVGRVLAS